MRVEWLEPALAEFDEAMSYIAERNPQAAKDVAQTLYRCVEQLRTHPHLGRKGRVEGTHELVIANTHFVIPYRIRQDQNVVEVLAVMHDAREWPDIFPHA